MHIKFCSVTKHNRLMAFAQNVYTFKYWNVSVVAPLLCTCREWTLLRRLIDGFKLWLTLPPVPPCCFLPGWMLISLTVFNIVCKDLSVLLVSFFSCEFISRQGQFSIDSAQTLENMPGGVYSYQGFSLLKFFCLVFSLLLCLSRPCDSRPNISTCPSGKFHPQHILYDRSALKESGCRRTSYV